MLALTASLVTSMLHDHFRQIQITCMSEYGYFVLQTIAMSSGIWTLTDAIYTGVRDRCHIYRSSWPKDLGTSHNDITIHNVCLRLSSLFTEMITNNFWAVLRLSLYIPVPVDCPVLSTTQWRVIGGTLFATKNLMKDRPRIIFKSIVNIVQLFLIQLFKFIVNMVQC